MIETDKIYNEDCIKTLDRMNENELDLTVTSPPYNNNHSYDIYDDSKEYHEYIKWLDTVFTKIKSKTKHGGRLVINIGDGQNGAVTTYSDLTTELKIQGWEPITTIIWNKQETSNRCAWGSWSSPSCPSFPRPFEYITVFGNETKKLQTDGETDITDEEFKEWAYGIWEFPGENSSEHPAPFPEELPKRCIKMLSWKNSTVYDPFTGSGTTQLVAEKLDRDWIGSEISEEYCGIAQERIKHKKDQQDLF